ncbi:MAG: hypothetical protein ABL876_01255 [Chitinophagaceae bacterium]
MKKVLFLFTMVAFFATTFASTTPDAGKDPILHADKMFFPVGKTGKTVSLLELSKISVKELQALTGQKMNFFDKAKFRIAQKKLRDNINSDGTISNKKIQKALTKQKGGETGFHFGGFALGFFLGIIGVVIAYVINDDYKRNRVKWSWIGFGIALVLNIILIVAVFNSVD